ncbi:hypothetical protein [Kitasatospora sp. NPDC087271]|uniref:hypothetical protein n=1 Tax=Kitasatospora sp. NPDC087271 TaxID=3364067 RepID=UPI00381B7138
MEEPVTRRTEHHSQTSTTLCDLLPALRWGDPRQLGSVLDDPRLPDAWWIRTGLADALATTSADAIAHRAATALRAFWPHLTLNAALPHLRFCTEGQQFDLDQTVEQAVAGMPVADGDAVLYGLVQAQLHPFQHRGRDLSVPQAPEPPGSAAARADDLGTLAAALLAVLPIDAPEEIRSGAEAVSRWARDYSVNAVEGAGLSGGVIAAQPPDVVPGFLDSPLAVLGELIDAWDERQLAVARARMFTTNRVALEVLGEQFGVTRERMRQIQLGLEKRVQEWRLAEPGRGLYGHLLAAQEAMGAVAVETEFLALHEEHGHSVPGLELPLWQVLVCCLPDRRWSDGWLVQGDLRDLQERTRISLQELCDESAKPWAEALDLLAEAGIREESARDWLEELSGFKILDDHLLCWGRSVNERAEAVLSLVGRPLPAADLLARLDDGIALASLRNQLQSDGRFVRRDRDLYGLRRWGGAEYLGIREMIVRELEAVGGSARAEDVVSALCVEFDVSEKSVHAYLSGPGFERFQRGWVRLAPVAAEDGGEYQPRRDVARTRRCFQTGQGIWWYRLDVNHDHLRGSGFPVPSGFAVHLGLAPGGKIELVHQAGDATVAWGNQPTFGSLRPLLESLEAVEGDHVFLTAKDGRIKAQRIAQEPTNQLADVQCALRLMALSGQVDEATMPEVIGRRIGLTGATTMEEVYSHLRVRGDKDILQLLQADVEPADDGSTTPRLDASCRSEKEPGQLHAEEEGGDEAAAAVQRDPAWDMEIIPLLDEGSEVQLVTLARALAARGKQVPVFGYELGDDRWQADFAWDTETGRIAVVSEQPASPGGSAEMVERDEAYRSAGWMVRTAAEWLDQLDELARSLPDAEVRN